MKLQIASVALAAVLMSSCNAKTAETQTTETTEEVPAVCLEGQWTIEHIILNDSTEVVPCDTTLIQTITFNADSTFAVKTDCNTLNGYYLFENDSLKISDNMLSTLMLCPDSRTEHVIAQMLPTVTTVTRLCPTSVRVNTTNEAYLVLSQQVEEEVAEEEATSTEE